MKSFIILLISIIQFNIYAIEPIDFDTVLWEHIQKLSESDYKTYISSNGGEAKQKKEWTIAIESSFKRLMECSGNATFAYKYSVVNDKTLNAFAFPGGQFIFHIGTLEKLDEIIKRDENPDSVEKLKFYRESYIAPIIAHELSHYFQRHAFIAYKTIISESKMNKKNIDPRKEIQFQQDQEIDADRAGLILLQMANYNVSYFVRVLKFINENYQNELKNGEKFNPYFSSHPSPHERLSEISTDEKALHAWAAKMEKAFANIQMGQNLDSAIKFIQESLSNYPDNGFLLKADAVALHKEWLNTVSLIDQELKSIIDLPSFRDDMVFAESKTKAVTKKIPGDKNKFNKAIVAYRKVAEISPEPYILSNFATLLAYSDKPEDEKNAIKLAENSFQISKNIQSLNNLAIVYHLCDKSKKNVVLEIFTGLSLYLSPGLKSIIPKASPKTDAGKLISDFTKNFEALKKDISELGDDDFTPVLNLALYDTTNASKIAKYYLERMESKSEWALYISKNTGVTIEESDEENSFSVEGIYIGSSLNEVLKKWGKPIDPSGIEDGSEVWFYEDKGLKVYLKDGFVVRLALFDTTSPPLTNSLHIGDPKTNVEKTLGKNLKKQGKYFIYEKKKKTAFTFDEGRIEKIILFE